VKLQDYTNLEHEDLIYVPRDSFPVIIWGNFSTTFHWFYLLCSEKILCHLIFMITNDR
jgi:hypothetical protein